MKMLHLRFLRNSTRRSKNPFAWISAIFYLYSVQNTVFSLKRNIDDILQLHSPFPTEHVNTNTICGNQDGLSKHQYDLCADNPAAIASAFQGLQMALHECKRQFESDRWNCAPLETRNNMPQSSEFFYTGFKEAAFFHAMSSAGVTYAVGRACSLGKIEGCGCSTTNHAKEAAESIQRELQNSGDLDEVDPALLEHMWGTCDHNINFGMKLSRKFLDERQSSKDLYSRIFLHNNRVGRLVVAKHMRTRCSCHGTSGSCSLKTCWRESPPLEEVGSILKNYYGSAVKYPINNRVRQSSVEIESTIRRSSNGIPHDVNRKRKPRNINRRLGVGMFSLVYWRDSPDYCEKDPSIGFDGTNGRYCSRQRDSKKGGSCSYLCCNRGQKILRQTRIDQCNCRFHWCCRVQCDSCTKVEKVSICR